MKFILFFAAFICSINTIFSQSENKTLGAPSKNGETTVYYSLISDSPEDLKISSLMLPLWNLAGSKINSSIYDLNAGYFYSSNKFQGFMRYKIGLGDKIAPETYEFMDYSSQKLMFSVNKVPKSQELNLIGTYFFKNQTSTSTERIRLKQEGKVVTVTDIPATALKSVGFNIGYAQGFTWYNMNNTNVTAVTREGFEQEVNLISMSSIQTYKFIKLGLTFSKAINVKADFEGYGERSSGTLKTTWINLICAVQNKFDDVYIPAYYDDISGGGGSSGSTSNTQFVMQASIDGSNKKLPIGIEFGQRITDKSSIISYEYGVKYLPGFLGNINFMLDVGVNFNFNFLKKQ